MNKSQRDYFIKRINAITERKKQSILINQNQEFNAVPGTRETMVAKMKSAPKVVGAQLIEHYINCLERDNSFNVFEHSLWDVPKLKEALDQRRSKLDDIEQRYKAQHKILDSIRERIIDAVMFGDSESACIELLHAYEDESITEQQLLDSVKKAGRAGKFNSTRTEVCYE